MLMFSQRARGVPQYLQAQCVCSTECALQQIAGENQSLQKYRNIWPQETRHIALLYGVECVFIS